MLVDGYNVMFKWMEHPGQKLLKQKVAGDLQVNLLFGFCCLEGAIREGAFLNQAALNALCYTADVAPFCAFPACWLEQE